MSLATFAKFEGPDIVALMVCIGIGYFVGTFAPPGSGVAIYTSILVSYHLFLLWLVFFSNGHKEAGVSLPIARTMLTHAACLVVMLGPVAAARATIPSFGMTSDGTRAGMAATRHSIRVFQALCSSAAGLALFERRWLFSTEAPAEQARPAAVPVAPIVMAATADDFAAWQQHLARQKRGARPLGTSLKTEYEQWLLARQQSRSAQAADDAG